MGFGYPDLMFLGERPSKKIDAAVFEDLKLTALIGSETAESMAFCCEAPDILARQEMFGLIFSKDKTFQNHLEKLFCDMEAITDLARRYEAARCDTEKKTVFFSLANALAAFFSDSTLYNAPCALYTPFYEYFKRRTVMANFQKLQSDLNTVLPLFEKMRENTCKIHGDIVKISEQSQTSYLSRLADCAGRLGMIEIRLSPIEPRLLDVSIIEALAKLYPEVFSEVFSFYERHKNFYETEILAYRAQLQFYLKIAQMADSVKKAGIPLSYPKVIESDIGVHPDAKKIDITSAYDITLLTKGEKNIIPNDIYFDKNEPFFYLTGANGGGKTTFLRTVGVVCILFLNGCPVPCEKGEIYPVRGVFTHFPRDERFNNAGRYAEEQGRVNEILKNSQGNALVLLNETYSTTSESTALDLTVKLAERLYHGGEFGVYVTHQHGIGETEIPYLNVLIDKNDQNRRTYKVARQRSVNNSYAYDILKKYSLTRQDLEKKFHITGDAQ